MRSYILARWLLISSQTKDGKFLVLHVLVAHQCASHYHHQIILDKNKIKTKSKLQMM
jgi:hypothetical protein